MVIFVGAGPGAPDLITLRGMRALQKADMVIYAGSLVNPELLSFCREGCSIHNSAVMTLEQVISVIESAEAEGKTTVRLHTGDTALYSTIREQTDALEKRGIPYEIVPGVSSFCAAAAAVGAEYTVPGISQTVILTRMASRTPVPAREEIASLSAHGTSMTVFLSAGLLPQLQEELLKGAYTAETPACIVYKASWPEEQVIHCTVGTLASEGEKQGIRNTALILVGDFLCGEYERSRLYDPGFSTMFRKGGSEA